MATPEPVENEFRPKGSHKSEREIVLQKRIDTLNDQLNAQLDKTKALRQTFQDQMDKMREVNDKLQSDIVGVVQKHDDRLIKYMDLSDRFDELESKHNELQARFADLRGDQLPEENAVPE